MAVFSGVQAWLSSTLLDEISKKSPDEKAFLSQVEKQANINLTYEQPVQAYSLYGTWESVNAAYSLFENVYNCPNALSLLDKVEDVVEPEGPIQSSDIIAHAFKVAQKSSSPEPESSLGIDGSMLLPDGSAYVNAGHLGSNAVLVEPLLVNPNKPKGKRHSKHKKPKLDVGDHSKTIVHSIPHQKKIVSLQIIPSSGQNIVLDAKSIEAVVNHSLAITQAQTTAARDNGNKQSQHTDSAVHIGKNKNKEVSFSYPYFHNKQSGNVCGRTNNVSSQMDTPNVGRSVPEEDNKRSAGGNLENKLKKKKKRPFGFQKCREAAVSGGLPYNKSALPNDIESQERGKESTGGNGASGPGRNQNSVIKGHPDNESNIQVENQHDPRQSFIKRLQERRFFYHKEQQPFLNLKKKTRSENEEIHSKDGGGGRTSAESNHISDEMAARLAKRSSISAKLNRNELDEVISFYPLSNRLPRKAAPFFGKHEIVIKPRKPRKKKKVPTATLR